MVRLKSLQMIFCDILPFYHCKVREVNLHRFSCHEEGTVRTWMVVTTVVRGF